ncbi:hypothetical protein J2857_000151 [Neorhizobium galegae]|nr:hypothetical protein [Neorhizobium galegae]
MICALPVKAGSGMILEYALIAGFAALPQGHRLRRRLQSIVVDFHGALFRLRVAYFLHQATKPIG